MSTVHLIRFDAHTSNFKRISDAYCAAINHADELRRRHVAAEADGRVVEAERLASKLADAEFQIEVASVALTRHTRRTATTTLKVRNRPAHLFPRPSHVA